MADRVRLVQRVLQCLRSAEPAAYPGTVPFEDVAELRARARRLRALGQLYNEVRLSRHVTCEDVSGVHKRSGGLCVARDV